MSVAEVHHRMYAEAARKMNTGVSSSRVPFQQRNPNSIHSSSSESTKEVLNRMSTMESSNNENNRRINGSGVRRGSASNALTSSESSLVTAPRSSSATRPTQRGRSNSVRQATDTDDNVIIEEKRRRINGDGHTIHRYLRGRLLGKGGFAKVYLCTALDTNKSYAVKIVPKVNLVKARARQKLQAEIKIHRTLKHVHVCEYKHFFEDRNNCYILLELCHNQSMNEMIKRRKRLTEPEAAYFMTQLLEAVSYLHDQLVIHRDLKLGNLFLDKKMHIKVGDLGLATRLDSLEEKRKTICGTPNYIAPEVIQGDKETRGHSFEVDIWSMGVILFTILVGKPPYEAKDVKATYQRIIANEYSFPDHLSISDEAKDLIISMLQSNPASRPTLGEIAIHPFLTNRPIPSSLPSNATHSPPQWIENDFGELVASKKSNEFGKHPSLPPASSFARKPLGSRDINSNRVQENFGKSKTAEAHGRAVATALVHNAVSQTPTEAAFQIFDDAQDQPPGKSQPKPQLLPATEDVIARMDAMVLRADTPSEREPPVDTPTSRTPMDGDSHILFDMLDRLTTVLSITEERKFAYQPSMPRVVSRGGPELWVTRYVDYTSKYGLGFLMNDGSSGVYFNDSTKSILEASGDTFQYIERRKVTSQCRTAEPAIATHSLSNFPVNLQKKVTLLKHFRNYLMDQNKMAAVDSASAGSNAGFHLVYVKKWVRTKHAILFRLSDQTVQIVFYDQTEVLLTPDERFVTYVDKHRTRRTFYLTDELVGSNIELAKRLKYSKEILGQLVSGQRR